MAPMSPLNTPTSICLHIYSLWPRKLWQEVSFLACFPRFFVKQGKSKIQLKRWNQVVTRSFQHHLPLTFIGIPRVFLVQPQKVIQKTVTFEKKKEETSLNKNKRHTVDRWRSAVHQPIKKKKEVKYH
jgi:hypothetical protein